MITPTSWLISSNLSPNIRVTPSKLPKIVHPPSCMDLILRPRIVRTIPMPIFVHLGSSSPKLVLSQPHTDIVLRPTLALSDSPPVLTLDLASAKIVLPPSFTNLILRPEAVFPTSKSTLQAMRANIILPPSGLCVALSTVVLSARTSASRDFGSVFMPSQTGHAKLPMPATCPVVANSAKLTPSILPIVQRWLRSTSLAPQTKPPELIAPPIDLDAPVVPVKAPSPPVDLANLEFPSNLRIDPRVPAIREQMAAQTKVCEEKEIRVQNAALKFTGRRDHRLGRWVKALTQANKDLKIAKRKFNKLRREEQKILFGRNWKAGE